MRGENRNVFSIIKMYLQPAVPVQGKYVFPADWKIYMDLY